MPFYASIAPWYDAIFPQRPAQRRFVLERIKPGGRVLDIGSATGGLASALAAEGHEVLGIEPDGAMRALAEARMGGGQFIAGDMRALGAVSDPAAFDAVLCLGNTLVHLDGPASITQAINGMAQALKPGGALIIQIINYDRVLDGGHDGLPTIEDAEVRFERRYRPEANGPRIHFETTLTVLSDGTRVDNSILLYPLRRAALEAALEAAGLTQRAWFGGFDGSPARPEALPLIVAASAP